MKIKGVLSSPSATSYSSHNPGIIKKVFGYYNIYLCLHIYKDFIRLFNSFCTHFIAIKTFRRSFSNCLIAFSTIRCIYRFFSNPSLNASSTYSRTSTFFDRRLPFTINFDGRFRLKKMIMTFSNLIFLPMIQFTTSIVLENYRNELPSLEQKMYSLNRTLFGCVMLFRIQ